MFCSKCGKSLPPEGNTCPSCGQEIGQSRFEGSPYTSAQMHILPGDDVQQTITQSYTRTTYTSAGDEEMTGDVDTRTTYRPAYGGDSIPEDMRREMRAELNPDEEQPAEQTAGEPADVQPAGEGAQEDDYMDELSEEARSSLDAVDETLRMDAPDLSKYEHQPVESAGQSGISSDVSELLQQLESGSSRRSRRRVAYDDYADTVESEQPAYAAENPDMTGDPDLDDDGLGDDVGLDGEDQSDVFDDIDEEEFEELRHSSFSLSKLLKVLAALIAASALIVGGLMWANHIRGNHSSAPIENVSEEFYNAGVALMDAHIAQDSIDKILSDYKANGYAALNTALQTSAAEVSALLPEEATDNEKLFLQALTKIESNIANCLTSDAIAVGNSDAEAMAASDERWTVVENSVTMLKAAKSAAELTAIINGKEIDIVEPEASPTPTPAPNYNTLSKGDKSDEVFEMQNRLFELGFLNDDRDGAFGNKTQTAVKIFQEYVGLEVTGIADNETLTALYAEDAPRVERGDAAN